MVHPKIGDEVLVKRACRFKGRPRFAQMYECQDKAKRVSGALCVLQTHRSNSGGWVYNTGAESSHVLLSGMPKQCCTLKYVDCTGFEIVLGSTSTLGEPVR